MQIRFIKNIQFTKVLKAEGRMREFNFRKPNGREAAPATVDVSDDRGHRIVFPRDIVGRAWKILPPGLPDWMMHLEDELSELLEEDLSNY